MKFATKFTLCITLLITLMLSLGSILFIRLSFNNSLNATVELNLQQLTVEQYALESNLSSYLNSGQAFSYEKVSQLATRLIEYNENGTRNFALLNNGNEIIINELPSTVSGDDLLKFSLSNDDSYLISKDESTTYMILSTTISEEGFSVKLVRAYNISRIFEERQELINMQLILNIILVFVSAVAVRLLSGLLTKSINKLNKASSRIAEGSYDERTDIQNEDEFGQLSKNFDFMASTIEEKIHEQEKDLERKNHFITAFTHEVKTPTTAIIGHADMLRVAPREAGEQKRIADIIYREGKRLEHISGQLMILLGIRQGDISFLCIPVEKLVERVIAEMSLQNLETKIEVNLEPAAIRAEPNLIQSVLSNLITNSIRANPKDNTVHITGKINGERYKFTVTDYGDGIPEEDIESVTQLFYMVDKSRSKKAGGAGIGLHLCEQILALHHTSLEIQSKVGKLTSVSFYLEVDNEQVN